MRDIKNHFLFSGQDFINLLDNYEMSMGVGETVTSEERMENHLFLDAILETDVMKVFALCVTRCHPVNILNNVYTPPPMLFTFIRELFGGWLGACKVTWSILGTIDKR